MVKTLTSYTFEIDDFDIAIDEIKTQLDLANNMKKNTVGILACNYEFVLSGVVKAICDELPFDVVGSVSTAQSISGGYQGAMILTLMVMTSDDVEFSTVLTSSLQGDFKEAIQNGYIEATSVLSVPTALVFTIAPFMIQNSGDMYVDAFSEVAMGIPCFGTMAVDDSASFENSFTIYNGEHFRDRMAILLAGGEIKPKFYIASVSDEKILEQSAIITSSEGHILKEVNGRPLIEYFKNLGLTSASETGYALSSLPFMVDFNDGTPPIIRVFVGLTEEGYGICAGRMPEGATLRIGVFDKHDVISTTSAATEEAIQYNEASTVLIYSCVSRNMSLGGDMFAETEAVSEKIKNKYKYMMVYSGGEFCPTQIDTGTVVNRFHNSTFTLCIF